MMNKAEEYNSSVIDEIFDSISSKEQRKVKSKMLLAAKIEDAMKAKGWNKAKLLKETGQKNASVATKWFSGTHNFTHDTLFEIGEALGIDLLNINDSQEEVVVKYHVVVQSEPASSIKTDRKQTPIKEKSEYLSQIHSFNTSVIIAEA